MKPRPSLQLESVNAHVRSSTISTKVKSSRAPQLFIPGARTYGLTDRIPFHVQLAGPLQSLQQLFMFSPRNDKTSFSEAVIRVFLQRMVAVEMRGQKSARNTILAQGRMDEIPPLACAHRDSQDTIHLDWEGEVRWTENLSVGGFSAENIDVKVRHAPKGNFKSWVERT